MQLLKSRQAEGAGSHEEALVRAATAGDAQAFADLYERHLDRLFRYFFYRVGSRQDAEDLTEQAFLKAWQGLGSYDYRGVPFSAWLYRIAHNLLIDHRRLSRETQPLDEALEIEDDRAGPEELAERREEARELASALGELSPIEQSVVVLRFVERLDHRTVARIIDKSEVATRSIQSRALVRLACVLRARERSEP